MNKKIKKLLIFGVGETARLAYEYFTHDSHYSVQGFLVNKDYKESDRFFNLPVFDLELAVSQFDKSKYEIFIAISSNNLNRDRTSIYNNLKSKGYRFASYISSKAFIWQDVKIGENCFILENNVLQSGVEIGNNVFLWSGNHIGHMSKIMDNCFIASHVVISGFCQIGKNCFLGVNCCLADKIKIAEDNFIGMGAIINKDTQENGIYKGNPAQLSKVSAKKFYIKY